MDYQLINKSLNKENLKFALGIVKELNHLSTTMIVFGSLQNLCHPNQCPKREIIILPKDILI